MKRSTWMKFMGYQPLTVEDIAKARELKDNISTVIISGFWFCHRCEGRCERDEGENGQPAHCAKCGSADIQYFPSPTL
jgi:hypothetical protein